MTIDPYTILYDAVIACLTRHAAGRRRVVSWNSTRSPRPDVVSSSDAQCWEVRPTGKSVVLGGTSCSTEVVRTFTVLQYTGDYVLGKCLFPDEWALTRALYDLKYNALEDLEYDGKRFVSRVEVASATTGIVDPTNERKIIGWATQWSIEAYLQFANADMLTEQES